MEQFYLENTIFNVDTEGRQRNRGGGSDLDPGGADRPGDHLQIPAYQPGPDDISENYQ